jgi:hypothetical protein
MVGIPGDHDPFRNGTIGTLPARSIAAPRQKIALRCNSMLAWHLCNPTANIPLPFPAAISAVQGMKHPN